MDIIPLPTQDLDPSDSDHESEDLDVNHYVVRLTPHGKFTFEELTECINQESQICRYVIAKETVPQDHYHMILTTDEIVTLQEVKDIIRAFIVPLWEVEGKCPRGFGNKQYNIQESKDLEQAIRYALKDTTEYIYEGYTEEYIQHLKEQSFTKSTTKNFNSEFQELQQLFQTTNMDIREFMTGFIKLKSKYNQMVNIQHAYQYGLSQLIKREPNQAELFVENFLYKQ